MRLEKKQRRFNGNRRNPMKPLKIVQNHSPGNLTAGAFRDLQIRRIPIEQAISDSRTELTEL